MEALMVGSAVPTQETAMPRPMTYREIADDLAARIARGEYPPGARLPSYSELAELYSVGQTTAASAYRLLVDRRVVEGHPGRGMYVRED